MNTDDLQIDEYYRKRERDNGELIGCYCILLAVTAGIVIIGLIVQALQKL